MPMRAYMDVFTACLGKGLGAEIYGSGTEKSSLNTTIAVLSAVLNFLCLIYFALQLRQAFIQTDEFRHGYHVLRYVLNHQDFFVLQRYL